MGFPDPTKVFFVSQMIKGYGKIGFRFGKLCFIVSFMAFEPPKFLFGFHSSVRRLREDLEVAFDERASRDFHLQDTAKDRLYGVGGLAVSKLRQQDLSVVSSFAPDIVILEIGANDLAVDRPEVVGLWAQ